MLTEDTRIKVQNRNFGGVGYTIPDLNLHRDFQPNEVKTLTFDELFKLAQVPGGEYIIRNFLIIYNQEAIDEIFNEDVEPEYYYTEDDIINIMQHGSTDEFEDCLNFAPDGVLDLIKDLSVKLPLNDVAKRDLILKKLSFDVAGAIDLAKMDGEEVNPAQPQRKAAKPNVGNTTVRKVVKKTASKPE